MKTKTTLALSLLLLLVGFAEAQFSAASSQAGTITTSSTPQGTDWSNPSNVQASDNAFATCLITGSNKPSYNLDAKNWGFQTSNNALANYIPGNATINGIEVFITLKRSGAGKIRDSKIILLKAGSEAGSSKARGSTLWPASAAATKFGGSTDLWGATWTAADITDANFGIRVVAKNRGSKDAQAEIDYIRINVYFNQVFYYSKAAGNLELTTTWGTNTDGSGTNPANFTTNGQIFFIQNRTTATIANNLTISGAYTKIIVGDGITGTTLTIPSNYALTANVDVANGSSLTITNTTVPTIGTISDNTTVTYNAAGNQAIGEATYYNLTAGGSGTKSISSSTGSVSINNVLTIASGITVDNQGNNIFVYGASTGISNSGSAIGAGRYVYSLLDISTSISGTGTFSNLEMDFSTSSTAKTLTLGNATSITGALYLTDGIFSNGTNLTMNAASGIYIADGVLNNTISSSGYDVVYLPFTGSSKTTANELTGTVRNFDMQITAGITLNLNRNLVVTGNLALTSGTFDPTATNYNLTVGGNFTNNATLVQRNNTVTFNGASAQNLGGSSSQTFYDVVINNSGNQIVLNVPVSVTHQLTLTNGFLTSSATNLAVLGSSATISGGSSSSFVNGPLQWTVAATSATKNFPIGKGTTYRPISLSLNQVSAASTLYTAELFNTAPPTRSLPFTLTDVSNIRYYTITSSNNANLSSATVTINYGSSDGVINAPALRIAKSSGSNWLDIGGSGSANGTGSITSNNFYSFSDFVLANLYSTLPLKWISVAGQRKTTGNEIKWQTADEINITAFKLERSVDGNNWNQIAEINAANRVSNDYSYIDNTNETKSYYRIRANDVAGRISVSKTVFVEFDKASSQITLYPNPVAGKTLNCAIIDPQMLSAKQVEVRIFDMMGRLKYHSTEDAKATVKINCGELLPGHYMLMIQAAGQKHQANFMVE